MKNFNLFCKKIKKINSIYLSCLVFVTKFSIAQYPEVREKIINLPNFDNKTLHYGYFLGTNQYDFKFEYIDPYYKELMYKDITVKQNGFNVGLIGDLRINNFLNLRFEPDFIITKEIWYILNI